MQIYAMLNHLYSEKIERLLHEGHGVLLVCNKDLKGLIPDRIERCVDCCSCPPAITCIELSNIHIVYKP